VLAVYQAIKGARRARARGRPTLIECKTYRWHGHSEHDKAFYRTKEELAMWKSRDPLPTFTTYLEHMSVLTPEKGAGDRPAHQGHPGRCGAICRGQPDPAPEEAVTDLYA
jgi:pyruvate dehydrogenase E1 component alpha subunit